VYLAALGDFEGRLLIEPGRFLVAQAGALFASRGDNSGTHTKEKGLWKAAGIDPEGQKWYQQTGLGMGQTLNVAAEKKAYILTDRATYLSLKKGLGLEILVEGDGKLLNIYHVIELNTIRWPKVNAKGARAFADFMSLGMPFRPMVSTNALP